MYHRFEENKYPSTNTKIANFKNQLELIKKEKIKFINPYKFNQSLVEQTNLRKVMITIDDAFSSFYENAWPIIKDQKIPIILFVSTREVGKNGYMTWEQIREISKENFVHVGNHSHTHEYLIDYNLNQIKEDLLKSSDFLSIHVQGGERYKNCITIKELDKMKKTAFLINTSRGPIINEDDLIIALSTNEIAGAGLDVYEKEPLPENNKLRFLPNALLTPHIGYVTAENYSIYYSQMIEALESCVNGKPIRIIE